MARLPYVEPATADARVQETFAALPAPLNVFKMLANAPTCLKPMVQLGTAILGRSELDPVLRELLILQVARTTGSSYEWGQHVVIGRAVGVTDAQVAAIEGDEPTASCLDDRTRLALRCAREVLGNAKAGEATMAAMCAAFSPRAIVEVLLTVGYYRMLAGVLESCAVDWDGAIGQSLLDRIERR